LTSFLTFFLLNALLVAAGSAAAVPAAAATSAMAATTKVGDGRAFSGCSPTCGTRSTVTPQSATEAE